MKEINSFKKGLVDGMPIFMGYAAISFAFGIFASESGLTVFEALLISMTNVTSAGQLAGVPIIVAGGTLAELAVTQLFINIRYSLMAISLSQKTGKSVRLADRLLFSFVHTDEVFAVASSKNCDVGRRYLYGLIFMPYFGWSAGTFLGAVAGNVLPEAVTSALGIAIYVMLTAIFVPEMKKNKSTALCVVTAVAFNCAFEYIPLLQAVPGGFSLIICAVSAAVIFAVFSPLSVAEEDSYEV